MDRWADYRAAKLAAPAVVQHDVIGTEHLYWVWTGGASIIGPLSRPKADDVGALADAVTLAGASASREAIDPRDARIAALETENADLRRQLATRPGTITERGL